ncbi:MAG: glycosyltransferase, partial [Novosphingobium sp.]|nr:glycosyltransferase [Novosphingobium sp.]
MGLPPWPLSRAAPYRAQAATPESSAFHGLAVRHPRFTLVPRWGVERNPRRIARALLPMARALHDIQPFDLVDAQFFFPDGPAAAIIAQALDRPLTIKARGSDIHHWGTVDGARAQMLSAASQAAGLLAVSGALRHDMAIIGMPEERIAVHYTGLDHDRFRPMERTAARGLMSALPHLGALADEPLLVAPGALIPVKGQALAIQALARLPAARLALAGTGSDEARLRDIRRSTGVADRVHFLGQVSHEHLPHLLSAADAMVLPSEREGLANAWIEALACGTPLVIPDIGGAREVVRSPSAGRIVERTPEAIAAAV